MNWKGSGRGPIWRDWWKPRKTSVKITGVPIKIRTQHLPDTSLEHYAGQCWSVGEVRWRWGARVLSPTWTTPSYGGGEGEVRSCRVASVTRPSVHSARCSVSLKPQGKVTTAHGASNIDTYRTASQDGHQMQHNKRGKQRPREANSRSDGHDVLHLFRNQRVHYRVHKSQPMGPYL
jgi:hypothetical protein